MPFFPYAPYQPQAEMSISKKHVQLPPVIEDAPEEDAREADEEVVEDTERVGPLAHAPSRCMLATGMLSLNTWA